MVSAPEGNPILVSQSSRGSSKPSVSERVYQQIRQEIITGVHPQGARINEVSLSQAMGVSRVPIRESIARLETDGFVKNALHRSPVVSEWTEKRVHDLFDVRLSLEVAAAGYAAAAVAHGRPTSDLLNALNQNDDTLDRECALSVAESSVKIHELVVQATGNNLLIELMGTVSQSMIWLFYLTSMRDFEQARHEHHELYEAILSGNQELAKAVAFAHIERGRLPSIEALRLHGIDSPSRHASNPVRPYVS